MPVFGPLLMNKPLSRRVLRISAFALLLAAASLWPGCKRETAFDYHMETGLARLRGGEFEAAIVHLKKATQRQRTSASAFCNLGIAYWKHGDHPRAIETLTLAYDLDSSDSRPLELLAYVYMDANRFDEARDYLERANDGLPDQPRTLTHLALLEFEIGEASKSKAFLEKTLQLDPTYGPALYNMGVYSLVEAKDKSAAQSYFARYVTSNRSGSRVGDALEQLRQLREPRGARPPVPQPAVTDRPAPPVRSDPVRRDPVEDGVAADGASSDEVDADDADDATDAGDNTEPTEVSADDDSGQDASLTVSDNAQPARSVKSAQAHWKMAMTAHTYKDWPAAVSHYEETIKLDPKLRRVAYNLGLAYKEMGKLSEARKAFETELTLDPSMVKASYMLAVILRELKENDAATKAALQTLSLEPNYGKAHFILGLLFWEGGDFEASRKHFDAAATNASDTASRDRANAWLKNLDQ